MVTTITFNGRFIPVVRSKKTYFDKNRQVIFYYSLKSLERFLRKEAKEISTSLILYWSNKMKVNPPKKLYIRKSKYVWGSYSSRDNININIRIVALPKDLKDYLIVHELSHKVYPNHSKSFWKLVDKYISDSRKKDRLLTKYHIITLKDYMWRKILRL